MTEEELVLANTLAAHPKWEWRQAMLVVCDPHLPGTLVFRVGLDEPAEADVPDLSDAATKGVLLAMVREAWGRLDIAVLKGRELWNCDCGERVFELATEGAALARAWLAAQE